MENFKPTQMQYHVTRENGTEPPFSNLYWKNHDAGLYLDIYTGDILFRSSDKFDSACGWPSFSRPANPASIRELPDTTHGMVRTEVRSVSSDSHLGHVFDDGPAPGGTRYCINSAAVRFVPRNECTAVFAAGCFWGTEAYFFRIPGVLTATAGYTGGSRERPSYEHVCTGTTGHAEAVLIEFDPARVSYRDLVRHLFRMHDPTTLNRQGNDIGTQYRSAVFVLDSEQERIASGVRTALERSGCFSGPVVTEITPFGTFWPAEEYHQQYLEKHPGGYCHVNLALASKPLEPLDTLEPL